MAVEPWTPAEWDEMRTFFQWGALPKMVRQRMKLMFQQIDRLRDEAEHYGHTREALRETALGIARLAGQREGMQMAAKSLGDSADHIEKYGDGSLNHDPQRIRAQAQELRDYAEGIREQAAMIGNKEYS